jgi:ssDNA-specific exonuclease RecJ
MLILRKYFGNYFSVQSFRVTFALRLHHNPLLDWKNKLTELIKVKTNNEKIISKASEMFLKLGFKSITMDDIAGEMCISKKTIYKYFAIKNY